MRTLLVILLCCFSQGLWATWTNLNTGIADELTGVVFWGNLGMVSGHHGLYHTGVGGATTWTRYDITSSPADSILYNQTRFYHCSADPFGGPNMVFACGQDTVAGVAVVMSIDLSTLTYSIIYQGTANSLLRHIDYSSHTNSYYASGDDGLLVNFTTTTTPTVIQTGYTNDFYGVDFNWVRCWIATEDTMLIGTHNSAGVSVNAYATPGDIHRAVELPSPNFGYSVGDAYYSTPLTSPQQVGTNPNFDFGPLNARCIITRSNMHFIGTDHGIFRSGGLYQYLEWQPSAQQHLINDFWMEGTSGAPLYACGANGVLLITTSDGGVTKPYASINASNACTGNSQTIGGITGSSSNCNWYIDGVLEHTQCTGFTKTFSSPGAYQIELFVNNTAGLSDTATRVIQVVTLPSVNLPTLLTDSILCKTSPAEITIQQSEPNVTYTLLKITNPPYPAYGTSLPGNGGNLTFQTDPLSEGGDFLLQATSTLAPCVASFSNQMSITVEQTTANFHVDVINAELGEAVTLYENSRDAQSFAWSFGPSASISASTLADPALSFSQLGQDTISLIATSANGCQDTVSGLGPFVYQPSTTPDSCWTLVNKGEDPTWSGTYFPDIAHTISTTDGFLTSGYFDSTLFQSQQGMSYVCPIQSGGYLAKYTYDGVIKWAVYSKQTDQNVRENIDHIAADSAGNIYVVGNSRGHFFDNTSDSTLVPSGPIGSNYYYYLNKLTDRGKLLWTLKAHNMIPQDVWVDPDQNILATCLLTAGASLSPVILNLNGVSSDTLDFTPYAGRLILKLSPQGDVLWYTGIEVYNAISLQSNPIITFDEDNHFYLGTNFHSFADLYSVGNPTPVSIPSNGKNRVLLAKYTLDTGQLLWHINSETVGGSGISSTWLLDMVTDSNGDTYLSGSNDCDVPSRQQQFYNTDGTTTSINEGEYFLAKVDSQGICEWIRGAGNTYYGWGFKVFKQGDIITSIGQFSQLSGAYETATFSSSSGSGLTVTIGETDYFVAQYDTAGNLISVAMNGDNGSALYQSEFYGGLFQADDGSYYVSRNIGMFSGVNNYDNFGSVIDTAYGRDGTITRFYPECGILTSVCDPNSPVQVALNETACDTYLSPSGQALTQSGVYLDTISYLVQCDSVFTINLAIESSSFFSLTDTACDAYIAPSGTVLTSSGLYTDTLTNALGCDSIIAIDLTIEPSAAVSLTDTACDVYVSPSGNILTSSGVYVDTLSSLTGCDSIITVNVTINPSSSASLIDTACDVYVAPSGTILTSSGIYADTLPNVLGCDSIISIDLTIDLLDAGIIMSSDSLIADVPPSTYQWLDCQSVPQIIPGETQQQFQPNASGNYAVIVDNGVCVDTSDCVAFVLTELVQTRSSELSVTLIPNPNSGTFTLSMSEPVPDVHLSITDIQGRLVFQQELVNLRQEVIRTNLPNGMYLVHLQTMQGDVIEKLVIY